MRKARLPRRSPAPARLDETKAATADGPRKSDVLSIAALTCLCAIAIDILNPDHPVSQPELLGIALSVAAAWALARLLISRRSRNVRS